MSEASYDYSQQTGFGQSWPTDVPRDERASIVTEFHEAASSLEAAVDNLFGRLAPGLTPDEPHVTEKVANSPSPLQSELRNALTRIHIQTGKLHRLRERSEV